MNRVSKVAIFFLILFLLAPSLHAQTTRIALEPTVSDLSAPVYFTSAKDGTNRRFIIQQAGRILVLQPGSTTITTFLDISSGIVLSREREQGLLGLAFHPHFSTNGRFFVCYTRQPDGATVIAEFHVS